MSVIGTAYSGMQASMMRMQASASNIANANSTGPVPSSAPASSPPTAPAPASVQAYQPIGVQQGDVAGGGTYIRFGAVTPGTVERHDPSSPHSNGDGMVAAPNVDLAGELVDQAAAKIAFEANLRVLETGGRTDKAILEIWA